MRLADPGRVASAVGADEGVRPVLAVGDALVDSDQAVAPRGELGHLPGVDGEGGCVLHRVLKDELRRGELIDGALDVGPLLGLAGTDCESVLQLVKSYSPASFEATFQSQIFEYPRSLSTWTARSLRLP